MVKKRLIIEMGMGIDQHGQDPTNDKNDDMIIANAAVTVWVDIFP